MLFIPTSVEKKVTSHHGAMEFSTGESRPEKSECNGERELKGFMSRLAQLT